MDEQALQAALETVLAINARDATHPDDGDLVVGVLIGLAVARQAPATVGGLWMALAHHPLGDRVVTHQVEDLAREILDAYQRARELDR